MTAKYDPNHQPAFLKGIYANRPAGAQLQQLPFLTSYLATDVNILSIVSGTGSTRVWLEFQGTSTGDGKDSVVASSAGVALPAYTASADKSTLTANANGAFPATDGVTMTSGRFLFLDGASAIANGLYNLTNGTAGTPWVLTRTADMPVGSSAAGDYVLVELGALNGSQAFVITNAPGSDVVGTNALTWKQFSRSAPYATPTLFVGGTNASNRNDGLTTGNPLATVGEAFARLSVRGWTGAAIVTLQGTTAEGANPNWGVPPPTGTASPVVLQGVYIDPGTGTVSATGGTQGSLNAPPTLGTTTTALAPANHAFRGMFQNWVTGTNAGKRQVIDDSSAIGTITNCGIYLGGAPANNETFTIQDLLGKIGWTGVLSITAPGGLVVDGVEFDIATGMRELGGGWVYATACRYISTGVAAFFSVLDNAVWYDNGVGSSVPRPGTITASLCGSRWDGSNGGLTIGGFDASSGWAGSLYIGAASMQSVDVIVADRTITDSPGRISMSRLVSFTGGGVTLSCNGCADEFIWNQSVANACRKTSVAVAAFQFLNCGRVTFFQMALAGTLAGSDLIRADGCQIQTDTISGLNAAAGTPLTLLNYAQYQKGTASTVTGGTPGADVVIDTDKAISWANVTTLGPVIMASKTGPVISFGGGMTQGAGATNGFLMDDLPGVLNSAAAGLGRRFPNATRCRNLQFNVQQNNMDTASSLTINLGGGASTLTVAIGAGATGAFSILAPAAVAVAAATSQFDVVINNPNATVGRTITLAGTFEYVPA